MAACCFVGLDLEWPPSQWPASPVIRRRGWGQEGQEGGREGAGETLTVAGDFAATADAHQHQQEEGEPAVSRLLTEDEEAGTPLPSSAVASAAGGGGVEERSSSSGEEQEDDD